MDYKALHLKAVRHAQETVTEDPNAWYPCGFVWINMRGTSSFARALKGIYNRNSYWGGVEFSMGKLTRSQSMLYKEALARAYIDFLEEHGVTGLTIRSNID